MATFYTGKRPVTKGRNWKEETDTYHGVSTYSNWSLLNPSNVLDGFPDSNRPLGGTRYSMPTLLEMVWSGAHNIEPMVGAGTGQRLTDTFGRFRPLEYKGLTGAKAFQSGYGRTQEYASDYANYSNFIFDGLAIAEPLADVGHAIRYTTTYGGASRPWIYQGVGAEKALDDVGAGADDYGHKKINQWFGVPSAKALL